MTLYDRYLATRLRLRDAPLPETVALVITERDMLRNGAYDTLESFFDLATQYGAESITVYVSVLDEQAIPTLRRQLTGFSAPREVAVRDPNDETPADAPIQISIGLGGKHELAIVGRNLSEAVAADEITPGEITEDVLEQQLVFPTAPDLVVKTGAERLSDFMIWQSVYSELYFTDVNWQDFRKRDYLRALRDFQKRQRRYGR